ncbi:hypothetical protein EUTSA_v10012193mg [Eutrema salsugineum]|uniref:gibberellin 2beta-dioxygenase n=1 Tax=Eutrema salsugineum TaxID=72664 RepID=V4KTU9_EUTSA|nr:gibberellin 2-beta-dioxygenase 4 [Eutrema salsugineum]ESQ30788.1 hypothetical protein EUTSA_v10012193mg [Eutrema salsugineum]
MVKGSQKIVAVDQDIPIIDMSQERSRVSMQIVKACETLGFFKLVNHGVDQTTISRMDQESINFFAKPVHEKKSVKPANQPFRYGFRDIGLNGDSGEVEYLLFHTNDPAFLSQLSVSSAVNCYIEAVKQLAREILDLTAEGLGVPPHTFSRLISSVDSDSVLRVNHYPPSDQFFGGATLSDKSVSLTRVGFGEHTDPQILTVLRSNGVGGLQVSNSDGLWVPVSPDPSAFCVNVGDLLQVMTNGRFISIRHRALTYGKESRLSTAYFAGPPLQAMIGPLPVMVKTVNQPRLYQTFTWSEYKKLAYSLRLEDSRLDMFRTCKK